MENEKESHRKCVRVEKIGQNIGCKEDDGWTERRDVWFANNRGFFMSNLNLMWVVFIFIASIAINVLFFPTIYSSSGTSFWVLFLLPLAIVVSIVVLGVFLFARRAFETGRF